MKQLGRGWFGGKETRNFEDFGFGGVGAQETIESIDLKKAPVQLAYYLIKGPIPRY